ncbi:MAG TPA: SAM-dependent methyltransferase [Planctomycetaceae bacterium]|nr:SAM-dependent methyltransferase [Planctomycetaceae bacterium]HIQ19747.1 SAM-dependent methyltransferase [Planctomycetota bacterium]
MFDPDEYLLIDFGEGRRLERFGPFTLDRPCPAAEKFARHDLGPWSRADARFDRTEGKLGRWVDQVRLPRSWVIRHGAIRFELKRTDFGHLGVFPEQAANWDWIAQQVAAAGDRVRVLNLFAYTGGSTLVAAAAGAEVSHVDAARNVVAWARKNAELSGLASAPIRWITEDAMKFVRRELKRGNRYDAVILDPPSYGHGPRGEVWRLAKHLEPLMAMCVQLTGGRPRFLLLTCHTPKFGPRRLKAQLAAALGPAARGQLVAVPMELISVARKRLPSGTVVRWQRDES